MMIVNYLNVGGPGNVPPTLIQANGVNTVIVALTPTNSADNSQIITHQFGLSTAELSAGWPRVMFEGLDTNAAASGWYVFSQAANFTVLNRGVTTAGVDLSTGTAQVQAFISRDHTIVR